MRLRMRATLLALSLLGAGARAELAAEGDPDLYMQTMRAISEGRQDDANEYLGRMLAKGAHHASEWLDLAMIQCAIGHGPEAELLFKSIEERFDPPPGIREIINQQRTLGCQRRSARAQLLLTLGRGYDRNVNQGASNPSYTLGGTGGNTIDLLPEYLPQSDQYTSFSGGYTIEAGKSGTVIFAQALARRNDHLADYNTTSLFGGVEQPIHLGRWKLRAIAFGGMLTLGGRLYQEQWQTQLKVIPPLKLPSGMEFYTMAGAAHVNYKTLTNFDANSEELRMVLSYRRPHSQLQLSAGGQNDHATGARPGGDRRGWSVGLSGYHRLNDRWQLEADLSRQTWRGASAYAAGLIDQIRYQDTRVLRAGATYLLSEHQSVQLEGRHVQNKENISIFQYKNAVWQLSWQWTGF